MVYCRFRPGVRTSGPKPLDRISGSKVLNAGINVVDRLAIRTETVPVRVSSQ